jgi:hypothetical protein
VRGRAGPAPAPSSTTGVDDAAAREAQQPGADQAPRRALARDRVRPHEAHGAARQEDHGSAQAEMMSANQSMTLV